jgi:hypothetical protein
MHYLKILLIVFLICLFGYYLFNTKVLAINCYNQSGECNTNLKSKLNDQINVRLININNYLKNKLDNDFSVKEYHAQILTPSVVRIDIIERIPKNAITNNANDWWALVDENGYVISLEKKDGLPTVIIDNNSPKIGDKVSADIQFALNLMTDINYMYKIPSGLLTGDLLQIDYSPNIQLYFPLKGDRQLLIGSMVLISKRLQNITAELDNKRVIIDLRYKNPIIKT